MNYNSLLTNIYDQDLAMQEEVLTAVATEVRRSPALTQTFLNNKMFFAGWDDYIKERGGSFLTEPSLDLYDKYGQLKDVGKLWIPLYDLRDDCIGFGFYDDGTANPGAPVKYRMQRTFEVSKYINVRRQTYIDAIKDGYIFVCDGFMDKYHIEAYDMHSASLYGSSLSTHKLHLLKAIDNVILCMDNDEAGVRLANTMTSLLPNVHILKQQSGKDMDDYLKNNDKHHALLTEYKEYVLRNRMADRVYELEVCS